MASIPTFGSTTAEAALHELLTFLTNKQTNPTDNPNNTEMVTAFSRDNRTGLISATLSIPSTSSIATDGSQTVNITTIFS